MSEKKFVKKPAGYPKTSATEQTVKDIFNYLLDRVYIKGDLRTLDKVPNSDGILEITDEEQFPIGKIDVQLKTLQVKNYSKPCYQVEDSLLAYCDRSILPVILVVVNKKDKKAYWKHFDRKTLIEVSNKIKGKSVSIPIPIENCIDSSNNSYIEKWTTIVSNLIDKVQGYDDILDEKYSLIQSLEKLQTKLESPTNLPLQVLKEVHEFIDIYNYILDREFTFVKNYLYPNYWKIGIGVFQHDIRGLNYILYPIEFQKNQTLVKSVKKEDYKNIFLDMLEGSVLSLSDRTDLLGKNLSAFAYKELEDKILKTVESYTFILPDEFAANEYLISFINTFHKYLDFDPLADSYSIKEFKLRLFNVLPLLELENRNYNDEILEDWINIDNRQRISNLHKHQEKIAEFATKVGSENIPRVRIHLSSKLYSFKAIKSYVYWLEKSGIETINRVYIKAKEDSEFSLYIWHKWSKEDLWKNYQLVSNNFNRLYELCLNEYFPNIKEYLKDHKASENTLVSILHYKESNSVDSIPYVETYYLRPPSTKVGEQYFYYNEDEQLPINREDFFLKSNCDVEISEDKYQILKMQARKLDFICKASPINELLKSTLKSKLEIFFRLRKSHKSQQ